MDLWRETHTVQHGALQAIVRRASVLDGFQRDRLIQAVDLENDEELLQIAQIVVYPALIAGTESAVGMKWPITFDEYLDLPDAFSTAWVEAIFDLNPQWKIDYDFRLVTEGHGIVECFGLKAIVRQATTRDGLRREKMAMDAIATPFKGDMDVGVVDQVRLVVLPAALSVTDKVEGLEKWPITWQEFLELPDQFGSCWYRQVFALNPHWLGKRETPEELEKKET